MNLVMVPFHDWRKIQIEGFRTRDAHFIETLSRQNHVRKLIVNRPTTPIEILLKRKQVNINGNVIFKEKGVTLYEVSEQLFLIDFVSWDLWGQFRKGYRWFMDVYSDTRYHSYINKAIDSLGFGSDFTLLNQNVFAYGMVKGLAPKLTVFDAWDNFTRFRVYSDIQDEIRQAYASLAGDADYWITNSPENIEVFMTAFHPREIHVITNGVDLCRFGEKAGADRLPGDMRAIPRPIIGFGGKISQLIDVELLNRTMELCPELSFVFVGQILDKEIYHAISKPTNFFYLGDKHYDLYPEYVRNFDICILPYVTGASKKSGANSIKVYEYLSLKKKVVGTRSSGLEELQEYAYVIDNAQEFSENLKNPNNNKKSIDVSAHSWNSKVKQLLSLID